MTNRPSIRFAFFGSSRFSVLVLDELKRNGLQPVVVVTTPDMKRGRGLVLHANPVKEWATAEGVPVLDPVTLDGTSVGSLAKRDCDVFIVASYGKIIPTAIIDIPPKKTLNVHPSLLPKYRGASPLQSAMLDDDKQTGVTIIRLDEKMDHGPIIAERNVTVDEWPIYEDFEALMAREGGQILAEALPKWVAGEISERPQDDSQAIYTEKIAKEDGLIEEAALEPNAAAPRAYAAFRKIQAFHQWPTAYFFAERRGKRIRVKIAAASFTGGRLTIERVIPEGSREMAYGDFLKGGNGER